MAKNSIRDYDATSANNTDIQSIDISEGCAASGINNALREIMTDLKNVSTGAVALETPAVDQLNFGDNAKAIFGAGTGDLEIYSDGAYSRIMETGGLFLVLDTNGSKISLTSDNSKVMADFIKDSAVQLRHNGSQKFSTTSTGVDVTGTVTTDGLTVETSGTAANLYVTSDISTSALASRISLGNSTSSARFTFGLLGGGGEVAYLGSEGPFPLYFQTGGTERMRIGSDGRIYFNTTTNFVGQGNTSTGQMFQPEGTAYFSRASGYSLGLNRNGDGELTNFSRSGSFVGSINVTSSSTSYNTSSDHRLKENVADMTGAIDRVKALAPKRFNFIADADTTVDGFLAHEAQAVVPEAVTGTHNEIETWTQQEIDDGDAPDGTSVGDNKLDGDGNTIPVMQGIDQSKLVPLLTGALQEAIAKIETLETQRADLEARLTALENA